MYLLRHVGLYGFNGSERVYMVSEMAWTGSRAQHRYVRGNTYIFFTLLVAAIGFSAGIV